MGWDGRDDAPAVRAVDAAYLEADLFNLDTSLAEMMTKLANIPLRHQPGTTWDYSIGADIQARLVETLSGMSFDQFLQRRLFELLGTKDSGYRVKDPSRLAAVHRRKEGELVPCGAALAIPSRRAICSSAKDRQLRARQCRQEQGSNGSAGHRHRLLAIRSNDAEWR